MRIECVDIPAGQEGLASIKMRSLGDLVVLAGANGSGKSRILRTVMALAREKFNEKQRREAHARLENVKQNLKSNRESLQTLRAKGVTDDRVHELQEAIRSRISEIENVEESIARDGWLVTSQDVKPIVVDYRPARLELRDPNQSNGAAVNSAPERLASELNFGLMFENGLLAVENLLRSHALAHSSTVSVSPEARAEIDGRVNRLKSIVREFLHGDLAYTIEHGATIFGLPIASAALSNGQLVLLQIALSVFFQNGSQDSLLVFMDEPESHLHPDAVIRMLDQVRAQCPKAQIWIATHSLSLLAHVRASSLWFVKEGDVSPGGLRGQDVLNSLLGAEEGAAELSAFLSLPAKLASLQFAVESFVAPMPVDTAPGDPQTDQTFSVLRDLAAKDRALTVLDFGAGKGRLLAELIARSHALGKPLQSMFEYFAFDPALSEQDKELLSTRIRSAYGDSADRLIESSEEMLAAAARQKIDVVVMCNVLHEVEPKEWAVLFGPEGILTKVIREDGALLVVEDQLLKFGERAHEFGYLVLDSPELKILFGSSGANEIQTRTHPLERYADRLKAHVIPQPFLARVTRETTNAAIEALERRSFEIVSGLYGSADAGVARRYAFWAQQNINARMFLK